MLVPCKVSFNLLNNFIQDRNGLRLVNRGLKIKVGYGYLTTIILLWDTDHSLHSKSKNETLCWNWNLTIYTQPYKLE